MPARVRPPRGRGRIRRHETIETRLQRAGSIFLLGVVLFKIIRSHLPHHLALEFRFSGQELAKVIQGVPFQDSLELHQRDETTSSEEWVAA